MAVAIQEVIDVLEETQRRLRVIAPDDPGRDASLSDLRLLHKWLTTETTASSATRLNASRQTVDRAMQLVR